MNTGKKIISKIVVNQIKQHLERAMRHDKIIIRAPIQLY